MGRLVNEEEFLKEVLKDQTFADFYTTQKSKIPPIKWTIEPKERLQQAKGYALAEYNSIHFDHIPNTNEGYFVAHEVIHLVLSLVEGYPSLECTPYGQRIGDMGRLAGEITSMIQDAVVDTRLVEYGIDVKSLAHVNYKCATTSAEIKSGVMHFKLM